MPERPAGPHVPVIQSSMAAILVARSDRVDKYIRPYTVPVKASANRHDTRYDIIKLWNFFWAKRNQFDKEYEAEQAARGVDTPYGPGVPKADWWVKQLPELWAQTSNEGPGEFKPSPYIPVRWTDWQLKQFDESPILGYLHRPVKVPLTQPNGAAMKHGQQAEALRTGWQQAVAMLPEDRKPSRVFYDTSLDKQWVIPVTQALQGNAEGIELDDVHTGYDIGHRLGNTGVSSALVQIGLAIQAGYEDGRSSATINLTEDGYAGIIMVTPPDTQTKENNRKTRGDNPFLSHVN